jgi:hypothetical protein
VATNYATLTELKPRIGIGAGDAATNTASDGLLQQLLNSSAHLIDMATRLPPLGQVAFHLDRGLGVTRYFDDDFSGVIKIDDALAISAVTRSGVTVTYTTDPPNETPITALVLDSGGSGHRTIAVTGTWGYCTTANRPAVVKEATLVQAAAMYQSIGADMLQDISPFALLLLDSLMRPDARAAAEKRRAARERLAALGARSR